MTQIHFMLRFCNELAVRLDPAGALPARQLQHASPSWRNAGRKEAYMLMLRPGHALQHCAILKHELPSPLLSLPARCLQKQSCPLRAP